MTTESELREKLRKIEALFAGAGTPGERNAAEAALGRVREKLRGMARTDPPIEMKFTMGDQWSRQLFTALCRRYGLEPFRYYRQRYTTVMLRVPEGFVNQILWPEFQELDLLLHKFLSDVTLRLIRDEVHADTSDVVEVAAGALPAA